MLNLAARSKKKLRFDLLLILIINTALALLFAEIDLFEQLTEFTRAHEALQLDELFLLTFSLLISFIYFSLRRWRDSVNSAQFAEQQASKDLLTKLCNRRCLKRKIDTEWDRFSRYREDFCLVIFDLDDFNKINENLGYLEGDRVLIEVAKMLLTNTRKTDFCARWGEEEFLILCPVCKAPQALILAEKLRSTLYRTLQDGVELSASFGVVQSDATITLDDLMKRVDFALHKAKSRGKNCVDSG